MDKDPSLIPSGSYCYRVEPIGPGEVLSRDIEAFGRTLREFPYSAGSKEVLCPYWERTGHGTVCCRFLDVETLDEDDPKARQKLATRSDPEPGRPAWIWPGELDDELKICGVREELDDDEEAPW
ncbi:MAG: hypothetical protein H6746_12505 [Deltaproteobacteria bacterium]|nr:hypothetical protein [Deltaproteobacteria bacterium]